MPIPEPIRLTRAQVREVDRRAIEEYGIPGIVLMENAAIHAARVALNMGGADQECVVVCGPGNNGGDGFAVARHLHNAGWSVTVLLAQDGHPYRGDALTNLLIASAMGLSIEPSRHIEENLSIYAHDLLVDAVFGSGLSREVANGYRVMIDAINASKLPILSIDTPSGLDCDTGEPLGTCVRATQTVTFVAEKAGFANPASKQYTGEIIVADIGCPRELIDGVRQS